MSKKVTFAVVIGLAVVIVVFTGLRGQTLFQAVIEDGTVTLKKHFVRDFGRLRDVVAGPDGMLYILTNNRDGRGVPTDEDDQLIRINPEKL